jgi:hypothetical protein
VDVAAIAGTAPATGAPIAAVAEPTYTAVGLTANPSRRVAIYRSYNASMDEGWTRWVFDSHKIPFTTIVDRDVRAGNLNARFDVIILPDQSSAALKRGLGNSYPDSLRGGLGEQGASSLSQFVQSGGTLIAFNEASEYAIEALQLPVRNVLAGVRSQDFYAPGSILGVELRRDHPIAQRFTASVPAIWFEDSPAFEITDASRATAVATYPAAGDPLLSGWLLGGARLNGKAALVDVRQGSGHAVLFGFRPQYRGQSMATYPLIWGAIMEGAR